MYLTQSCCIPGKLLVYPVQVAQMLVSFRNAIIIGIIGLWLVIYLGASSGGIGLLTDLN